MYKLGLVSISFRKHSVLEILTAVRDAGLSCVEWGSDLHAPKDDIKKLQQIANLQEQMGISCSSYGSYFRFGTDPLSELEGYIRAAKILGTDVIRLWCGDKNSEDYSKAERQTLFDDCRAAAEIAQGYGVTLCMECHNNTYTNRSEAALELMNAVNSDHFGMYWQPNQFKDFKTNMEYAERLAPYTRHVHVFEWRGEERFPLASGLEVWKKFLAPFKGQHALLLEFMPDDRIESLKDEAIALKELVK